MESIIRNVSLALSLTSTLVIALTAIFLATSLINPDIYGIDPSDWLLMLIISGILFASTAIPFTLATLASNLMIGAYSKDKKVQAIRLLLILLVVPLLLWILIIPFVTVVLLTYAYGILSSWISSYIPGVPSEMVGGWVFLALVGQALSYAIRYHVYDWFLSTKKGSSLNLAESQYQVVYENVEGGHEKTILDFVKAGIRLSAINLIMVLMWSFIMISGVTTMPLEIGTLPAIIVGFILGGFPIALLESKIKRMKSTQSSG
jgi:hypothetical protein